MVDFMEKKMESSPDPCMATGNRDISTLCDDVLIEILERLPTNSLFRFKCVSKKWRLLISHESYRRNPPLIVSALFYKCPTSGIKAGYEYACVFDGSFNKYGFDFFPFHTNSCIIDSCNGLVLWYSSPSEAFYVCDPITKKWVSLPKPIKKSQLSVLAFDPCVSSHFNVISFCSWKPRGSEMEIFSSETGEWVVHKVEWGLDTQTMMTTMSFFNGVLHVLAYPSHIVGINLDNGQCWDIELPVGVNHGCSWIGNSGNSGKSGGLLQFADLDRSQIRIWILKQCEKKEWVLKHSINVQAMTELIQKDVQPLSSLVLRQLTFLAFHPHLEVVFFWVPGMILSYHLEKKKFELVCDLGSESVYLQQLCVFPFLGRMLN